MKNYKNMCKFLRKTITYFTDFCQSKKKPEAFKKNKATPA